MLNVILLSVVVLSVAMLSVIMLSVVAPTVCANYELNCFIRLLRREKEKSFFFEFNYVYARKV